MLGGIEGRKRRGRQRMRWLDGITDSSEWTLGVGNGQGGLAYYSSWGCKESDMTERLNWTERDTDWSNLTLSLRRVPLLQVDRFLSVVQRWQTEGNPEPNRHCQSWFSPAFDHSLKSTCNPQTVPSELAFKMKPVCPSCSGFVCKLGSGSLCASALDEWVLLLVPKHYQETQLLESTPHSCVRTFSFSLIECNIL